MNKKDADVIVIGGGIIGTAITYQLSKRGKKVLLIEKNDLCSGTTGACDAYITPHTKAAGFSLDLCIKSQEVWKDLEEELDADLEYEHNCGGLQVCQNQTEFDLVSDNSEKLKAGGLEVHMLDIEEARKIEPALSEKLRGALYCPSAGQVNPFKTTFAYMKAAKRNGAEFKNHTAVTGIIRDGEKVVGVNTDKGDYYADAVVNAAGAWGGEIAKLAGYDFEILPRRGQLIVSEPVKPIIHTTMQTGNYMVIKHHPELITDERVKRLGIGYCIEQTDDGSIIIGFTREFVGFDKSTTLESIEGIIETAIQHIPELADIHFIRTFSGFRPYSPDNKPYLGPVDGAPGFYMAAGHEGDGIALSAITGVVLAEMIVDGNTSFDMDSFSPNRIFNK
ncbi:MAG: FAD-dependent oxidoreductase [Tissierellia bacterium]|nr:FAD-dependent oxidoreductase [Tissierellia bacterium]MDD4725228.1 FAD-dependent oxidoreductase [Tissierellia bacterium]